MEQLNKFQFIAEDSSKEIVKIDGAVNLNTTPISEYKVNLAYGDLTLIVAMIRDYIKGLDKMLDEGDLRLNKIEYEAYYRKKFLGIADRISQQIDYDYDEHLKKCLKKQGEQDNSDVGEEALSLALKRV